MSPSVCDYGEVEAVCYVRLWEQSGWVVMAAGKHPSKLEDACGRKHGDGLTGAMVGDGGIAAGAGFGGAGGGAE